MDALESEAKKASYVTLKLNNYAELAIVKNKLAAAKKCLIFFDRSLGRGISLKLGEDATALVVCTFDDFDHNDVKQMIGRSNRSFGRCNG